MQFQYLKDCTVFVDYLHGQKGTMQIVDLN